MTFIGGLESSSNLFAYGTDGFGLYPLFTTPSESIVKSMISRYWGLDRPEILKEAQRFYVVGESFTVEPIELFWTTDFAGSTAEGALEGQGQIMSPNNYSGSAPVSVELGGGTKGKSVTFGLTDDVTAVMLGFKVATVSPDFEINQLAMGYLPVASIY